MIKLCIFDLDGTLADTIESLTYSVGLTLQEMNLPPITKEQCQSFVGNGARVLLDRAIRAAGDSGERLSEAMEIYARVFDENCTYHVTPYEGINEAIRALGSAGVKLAVLSNKPHRQSVKVVETVFGAGTFDVIQGQQEQIPRKPDPAGVLMVLDAFGLSGEECLYIGDSEVDIETGKNAGVKTVGVTWGFRTEEQLLKAGAGELIHEPAEIVRIQEQSML